jgi:hypothetical protein
MRSYCFEVLNNAKISQIFVGMKNTRVTEYFLGSLEFNIVLQFFFLHQKK